jgi:hypothetical protein
MALAERIAERARKASPAKAAKTLLASPLYLMGFVIGGIWYLLAWGWSAIVVGFTDGARRPR